jgi:hypothetical protein
LKGKRCWWILSSKRNENKRKKVIEMSKAFEDFKDLLG